MLILASASPRRSELLRNAAIPFTVDPAHVREEPLPQEEPLAYAQRLARDKALAVFARHPDDVVLGADTVVVVDQHLLEKPVDADDAARMLRLLSGRAHQVITGVCVIAAGFERTEAEMTQVYFSRLSDDEIAAYVAQRRADGQGRGIRHPGNRLALDRPRRRLLLQCGGIAGGTRVSAAAYDGRADLQVRVQRSI